MRARSSFVPAAVLTAILIVTGCESPEAATGPDTVPEASFSRATGVVAVVSGGGSFDAGVPDPVRFAFSAVQHDEAGAGSGRFHFSATVGGELVEFHGSVTCVTTDLDHRRAWVGGVVTRNNSERAAFTGERNEPGRDIWFRVVDYGKGQSASQPDRTTFVGFEGDAEIATSADYCAMMPWPEGDARTGPVVNGNINVIG